MKPWAVWFYKSKAWIKCRASFLKSKFFVCNRCGGAATIAHHIIYLTPNNINDPSVILNWDKLEAVCHDCHNKEHMAKAPIGEGLMFDDEGNLIQL
jgi:thymidine kinase